MSESTFPQIILLSWRNYGTNVFRSSPLVWFAIETRIPLKPALGGICSLANYSVPYEETHSNRVSDFRDFVCSLFPNAILFYFLL